MDTCWLLYCSVVAPAFTCPTLDGPTVINGTYFEFYCNLSTTVTDPSARFNVTFLFDGSTAADVLPVEVTAASPRATLHEKYLNGKLGKTVRLSVEKRSPALQHHWTAAAAAASSSIFFHRQTCTCILHDCIFDLKFYHFWKLTTLFNCLSRLGRVKTPPAVCLGRLAVDLVVTKNDRPMTYDLVVNILCHRRWLFIVKWSISAGSGCTISGLKISSSIRL